MAGPKRDRDESLREAAHERPDQKDRDPSQQAADSTRSSGSEQEKVRTWTHEGGMVEQQASAMAWVKDSHEQRQAARQSDHQEQAIPEQENDSPSVSANDNQQPDREDAELDGQDQEADERVRQVLADYDRNSGREQERQQAPANDNLTVQPRNNNDNELKAEHSKDSADQDEQEEERANRIMNDLNRPDQERDQGIER